MKLLGSEALIGTVSVEKYAKFNSLRNTIVTRDIKYDKYLRKKCWAIRTFVEVFLNSTPQFMVLIDQLIEEESNGKT